MQNTHGSITVAFLWRRNNGALGFSPLSIDILDGTGGVERTFSALTRHPGWVPTCLVLYALISASVNHQPPSDATGGRRRRGVAFRISQVFGLEGKDFTLILVIQNLAAPSRNVFRPLKASRAEEFITEGVFCCELSWLKTKR